MKKRIISLIIGTMFISGFSVVAAASDNLYKNGDFEWGFAYPTKMMSGSTGMLTVVKEPVYEGKYALKISQRDESADFWGQSMNVQSGKTYIFSGYARLADDAANKSIPADIYWVNGSKSIEEAYSQNQQWLYKTCWTNLVQVVKAKEDATVWPELMGWYYGTTTDDYYVDDLHFEELKINDIQKGNFPEEVIIPRDNEEDKKIELSGNVLNQFQKTEGMGNEKIIWSFSEEKEGVSLDGELLTVSNNADEGTVKLKASVTASFDSTQILEKSFEISLIKEQEIYDYKILGEWVEDEACLSYNVSVMKKKSTGGAFKIAACVYDENERLTGVKLSEEIFVEKLYENKDISLKLPKNGTIKKAFIWDFKTLKPIDNEYSEEDENITYIYVAPDGNDENDGTKNNPLKTVSAARDKIRALKSSNKLGENGVVCYLRGGEYDAEYVLLDSDDSGTETASITYMSYPGENAEFKGSIEFERSELKKLEDEEILKKIPENARNNIYYIDISLLGSDILKTPLYGSYSNTAKNNITGKNYNFIPYEIFCGEKIMNIARYPNEGYMKIEEVVTAGDKGFSLSKGENYTPFTIKVSEARIKNWGNAKNAVMSGYFANLWANESINIANINEEEMTITSEYPAAFVPTTDGKFYVYNLIEELDNEGEYFVEDGILYLYPPEGDDSFSISVTAEPIFDMNGSEFINIDNIDFKYMRSLAIKGTNISNVMVEDCEFGYMSTDAVKLSGELSGISNCYIHDTDGGIVIYGGSRETLEEGGMYINDSHIENYSRLTENYTSAIEFNGVGVHVSGNVIHGSKHLACDWSGNNHIFEYNEIYDVCNDTDDASAIYEGLDPLAFGNKWRYNYFHDIGGESEGTLGVHAIYMDDGQVGGEIYGNVFENIKGSAIHHAGRYSDIYNNVFINVKNSTFYSYRDGTITKDRLSSWYLNDIWQKTYPQVKELLGVMNATDWNGEHENRNNVLVNTSDLIIADKVQGTVITGDNYITQSFEIFKDADSRNYILKEDSEVFDLLSDFENIPFDKMKK